MKHLFSSKYLYLRALELSGANNLTKGVEALKKDKEAELELFRRNIKTLVINNKYNSYFQYLLDNKIPKKNLQSKIDYILQNLSGDCRESLYIQVKIFNLLYLKFTQ